MRLFLKKFRFAMFGAAVLCIALGAAMLIWPNESTRVLCYGFGGVLLLSGLLQIVSYISGEQTGFMRRLLLISGILSAVVGVWVLFTPEKVLTLTVIVMGIVLLYHGVMDVKYGFDIRRAGSRSWGAAMLFGIATCGIGVLVLVDPFEAADVLLIVAGIGFIFDGITDLFTVFTVAHAQAKFEKLAGMAPVIELDAAAAEIVPVTAAEEGPAPAEEPAQEEET